MMRAMLRRPDKYESRPDSSEQEWEIAKVVKNYRFDPSSSARLKAGMDVAAVIYLALAALVFIIKRPTTPVSFGGALTTIGPGFTLLPMLFGRNTQVLSAVWSEPLVFILVASALLAHESDWLKKRIYYQSLLSGRGYEGFSSNTPTLTRGQQA